MFKFLKQLFRGDTERLTRQVQEMQTSLDRVQEYHNQLETRLAETYTQLNAANAELNEKTSKLEEYERKEAEIENRKNSSEPWVEIKSADYDEVRGFRVELDWNDAFVQHLRDGGMEGRTDEQIVQKWIGMLYGNIIERLETKIVDDSDKPRTNDFM